MDEETKTAFDALVDQADSDGERNALKLVGAALSSLRNIETYLAQLVEPKH